MGKTINKMGKTINKDVSGRVTISFPYDSSLIEKIRTINGLRWHKDKKHLSFPDKTLEKILKAFEDKEIILDPTLQTQLFISVIARAESAKQSQVRYTSRITHHDSEDLRRKLLSRKYRYRTVKGGVNVRYIQEILGHKDSKTTEICTHVSTKSTKSQLRHTKPYGRGW